MNTMMRTRRTSISGVTLISGRDGPPPAFVRLVIRHVVLWLLPASALLFAQAGNQSALRLDTGEHIYKSACVACHGPDGRGTPKTIAGFEPPDSFPDFTRCDQTTPEPN